MSSTEKAHDAPRRRSPLVVASVVAAVLVAGGGGAYFAAAGSGGDGSAGGRSETREDTGPAPLLALGTAGGGIAPGEPDPNGRGVVYEAAGELPDGPGRAAVHRATGSVTEAEVTRLAKALGITDAPRLEGTAWKAGAPQDGSGPVLEVNSEAPGTWTFQRFGAAPSGDDCPRAKPCPDGGTPGGGDPGGAVDEAAARKAAAPVLEAAGQGDAALRAGQLMGAVRVVNADPVVGGLPTYGWSTGVQVGPDGQVVGGSGRLKAPERDHTYPVVPADEAVRALNEAARGDGRIGIGGCATPVPHQDELRPDAEPAPGKPVKPDASCDVAPDRPATERLTITEAVFGLAVQQVDGRPALVPSWLFQVKGENGGDPFTLARTAVEPRWVKADEPPAREVPSGDRDGIPPLPGTSYTAQGSTLTVSFWGGVCDTYEARADESGGRVTVEVVVVDPDPDRVCIAVAEEQSVKVTLDAPLDGRTVVDGSSGKELPLRK
ncbi:hypothetical protein [Streptomyces genisteinicus]|uniref:Large membrane protein n=1 Tax=Streptomyces genisteinicus TaxID=2768068 RepID=A0A7H0HQV5_9ACTN|nr:hypothetical protein [Streptomyces genisteinicus]QNP62921.1 hypothetical protein IAG43_08195 [Streptomyces genisteinicus]